MVYRRARTPLNLCPLLETTADIDGRPASSGSAAFDPISDLSGAEWCNARSRSSLIRETRRSTPNCVAWRRNFNVE
jgi:hypothetical protein